MNEDIFVQLGAIPHKPKGLTGNSSSKRFTKDVKKQLKHMEEHKHEEGVECETCKKFNPPKPKTDQKEVLLETYCKQEALPKTDRKCSAQGCEKGGHFTCSKCKKVLYCSSYCQTNEWPEHKKVCGQL